MAYSDPPDDVNERIEKRNAKSRKYLEGRSEKHSAWANLHLKAANTIDAAGAAVGDPAVHAVLGSMNGALRGLFVGGLITGGLFILGASLATVAAPVIGIAMAYYAVKEGVGGYNSAIADSLEVKGAKYADKIASRGHAIAHEGENLEMSAAFDKAREEAGGVPRPSHIQPSAMGDGTYDLEKVPEREPVNWRKPDPESHHPATNVAVRGMPGLRGR